MKRRRARSSRRKKTSGGKRILAGRMGTSENHAGGGSSRGKTASPRKGRFNPERKEEVLRRATAKECLLLPEKGPQGPSLKEKICSVKEGSTSPQVICRRKRRRGFSCLSREKKKKEPGFAYAPGKKKLHQPSWRIEKEKSFEVKLAGRGNLISYNLARKKKKIVFT